MLTISRLSRRSIDYYERTANAAKAAAMDRQAAGGGLGEYYTEADTRVPTWLLAGDAERVAELTGLGADAVAGGFADGKLVTSWLDDGVAPNGLTGRAFRPDGVHGFDLTFAAPKSVSLVRALSNDINEKVIAEAHTKAVRAAMEYLNRHAGYTRVWNPDTRCGELQRLPGLACVAYGHETSRCGDPHLHTHVLVPNRQARDDGTLVSLDSKSLYHETKAAGIVYQTVLRHELHAERAFEWTAVAEHSGMAEIAGIAQKCLKAWSTRSSQLRDWAREHLTGGADAPSAAQLAAAQKATRPRKPESLAWEDLKEQWRADERGLEMDRAAHHQARAAREAAPRLLLDRARLTRLVAGIDKAAFTRADLVELVGALTPVDAPGDPRELIEEVVDVVAVRITGAREAHHREGHERYTIDAVVIEEEKILAMVDAVDNAARLALQETDLDGLSTDQARAIAGIAEDPHLVAPLQAPAGAGKTHSLRALRAAARHSAKEVLVLAPTGQAVDQALRDGAGDRGLTVDKALHEIRDGRLPLDRRTLIVVDEASMVGTPDLAELLAAATSAGAKTVLVGDQHQLGAVRKRGGMFEQLVTDLPWTQELSEVWRMRDDAEREASLGLRSGEGKQLHEALRWYAEAGRLHTGHPVAMAADAADAYIAARDRGHDAAIVCDRWEVADAVNARLQAHFTGQQGPAVAVARDQEVRTGDIIITRRNDPTIDVRAAGGQLADQVRNGNRWTVAGVDVDTGRIAAERLTDGARAILGADYAREHVTLGHASTVHSAQGMTVGGVDRDGVDRPGICLTVLSDKASRAMAYVGMTRGKDQNHAYIYSTPAEGDADDIMRRGDRRQATAALKTITQRDDRARTMHAVAETTDRSQLPAKLQKVLARNDTRRTARAEAWAAEQAAVSARQESLDRFAADAERRSRTRSVSLEQDYGLDI